jgi:carboxyl-terminal processing protease
VLAHQPGEWGVKRLLVVGAALLLLGLGVAATRLAPTKEPSNLQVFDAAWTTVDRHYFDREQNRPHWKAMRATYRDKAARAGSKIELYMGVLLPMMQTLGGSHVGALPPADPAAIRKVAATPAPPAANGAVREGLGFKFTFSAQGVLVTTVDDGSPLQRAGIGPGAVMVEMQGRPAGGGVMSFDGVFQTGGGPPQRVRFLFRQAKSEVVRQVRDLGSGVVYLRFDHFDQASVAWTIGQLEGLGDKALVLDLRGNDGGFVVELQHFAGALFDRNLEIGYRLEGRRKPLISKPGSHVFKGRLVVLVGAGTASAAEVLTDAVQHHRRGFVVGQRTQGAVKEAQTYPMPDGGSIMVPVSAFLGASGRRLEGQGVSPDIVIALDGRAGEDRLLAAALIALRN